MALAKVMAGAGTLTRLAGLGVALGLAGCQALPPQPAARQAPRSPAQSAVEAPRAPQPSDSPTHPVEPSRQALDLRVFLAGMNQRPGWARVNLHPQGTLYVMTEPIITRRDLIGIQSATDNQTGEGVLVVTLSDEGFAKIRAATAANPGLRLALVVGQTMLAAPGYAAPITEKQLAFRVGSRLNADKAARAVAGVGDPAASGL